MFLFHALYELFCTALSLGSFFWGAYIKYREYNITHVRPEWSWGNMLLVVGILGYYLTLWRLGIFSGIWLLRVYSLIGSVAALYVVWKITCVVAEERYQKEQRTLRDTYESF